MDDLKEELWICPLCSAEHLTPVIVCRRCECPLLLLNKIKIKAIELTQKGYRELGAHFYKIEEEKSDE